MEPSEEALNIANRVQRLERRLDEEHNIREALGSDVKDQQETMEALLEMLDKTITVEVRSRPPARQGVESLIMRP